MVKNLRFHFLKPIFLKIIAIFYGDFGKNEKKVLAYQHSCNKLNSLWIREKPDMEGWHFYTSHFPDRYTVHWDAYSKLGAFLRYQDLEKWVRGNESNNSGDIPRFIFLNQCFELLIKEGIVGHVAELGVYKGNSAFLLARYAKMVGKTCFLLDTFEGFDARDLQGSDRKFESGTFNDTSLEAVKNLVGDESIKFIRGYFPESITGWRPDGEFALVHIDCDLEMPIRAALEFFYPMVCKGGFLVVHDYTNLFWPGASKAVDEFFRNKPEFVVPIPDKSGTGVVRKK